MPTVPKTEAATLEVRRTEDGRFVQFGVVSDGAFHVFFGERAGDYDERVKAAQEDDS